METTKTYHTHSTPRQLPVQNNTKQQRTQMGSIGETMENRNRMGHCPTQTKPKTNDTKTHHQFRQKAKQTETRIMLRKIINAWKQAPNYIQKINTK